MAVNTASLEDEIYECALLPEKWPTLLGKLADIAGARGGAFLSGTTQRLSRWVASPSIEEMTADTFATNAINQTGRLGFVVATGSAGFIREGELYDEAIAARDPLYRQHLWPCGLGFATGTAFCMPTGEVLVFSLERERAKGQVEPGAMRRLDALRPHIARSAYLSARQELKRARDTVALLGQLGLPAIVFGQSAKVLAANDLVEALGAHVVWRAADRLAFRDRQANPMLQHALDTIEDVDAAAVRSFIVRGGEGQSALVAHLLPIRGSARDLFARCCAVLILTPVAMPAGPSIELIQSLFDLTSSEAAVARKIVAGETVGEIASGVGVSSHTVRSHIKGVLAKTGCRRQAEVAALLGNLGGGIAAGSTRATKDRRE